MRRSLRLCYATGCLLSIRHCVCASTRLCCLGTCKCIKDYTVFEIQIPRLLSPRPHEAIYVSHKPMHWHLANLDFAIIRSHVFIRARETRQLYVSWFSKTEILKKNEKYVIATETDSERSPTKFEILPQAYVESWTTDIHRLKRRQRLLLRATLSQIDSAMMMFNTRMSKYSHNTLLQSKHHIHHNPHISVLCWSRPLFREPSASDFSVSSSPLS